MFYLQSAKMPGFTANALKVKVVASHQAYKEMEIVGSGKELKSKIRG
jgi:hypothetical protein